MKRSRYRKKKYYGKGAKDFIRPTLNRGRIFVGQGLLNKKRIKKRRKVYGKGIFGPLSFSAVFPKLLDKRW